MTTLADEERGAPPAHLPEQSTPTKTPKSQSAQLARLSKTTARQFKMATYNTLPVSADVEADKPLLGAGADPVSRRPVVRQSLLQGQRLPHVRWFRLHAVLVL